MDGSIEYHDYLEPKGSVFYLIKQMTCKEEYEKNKKVRSGKLFNKSRTKVIS